VAKTSLQSSPAKERAELPHDQFRSFQEEFNKNRKSLQIEKDVAPFTEDKQHSWTRDGLPDIEDMNALLFDGPAAAMCFSLLAVSLQQGQKPKIRIEAIIPKQSPVTTVSPTHLLHLTVSLQHWHLSQVSFFEMSEICDSDPYALENVYNFFHVLSSRQIFPFYWKI
jgi:hypothetical protein